MNNINIVHLLYSTGIAAAVASAVGALVSKLIVARKTTELQKEIERLKQHNAISKETYQKLFTERIELYSKIAHEFENYESVISLNYSHIVEDQTYEVYDTSFYELVLKLKELVKDNQILISKNLSNEYRRVFISHSKHLKKAFNAQRNLASSSEDLAALRNETEEETLKLYETVLIDLDKIRTTLAGEF